MDESDENDDENGDKLFFKYLEAAYRVFLTGEDDKSTELAQKEMDRLSTDLHAFVVLLVRQQRMVH